MTCKTHCPHATGHGFSNNLGSWEYVRCCHCGTKGSKGWQTAPPDPDHGPFAPNRRVVKYRWDDNHTGEWPR